MATSFRHTVILLLTVLLTLQAQDSLNTDSKNTFLPYILPVSLIITGSAISGTVFEKNIQSDVRNAVGNDFEFGADDYIVHVPMAEIYLFDFIGIKAKNRFFNRSKNVFLANLASQAIVQSLKYSTDKLRPNGDNRQSFPSSHTNIAFTNATILFHEYENTNSFIAYSGFVFAAATGALRIMNNNHWTGDVLAGAGIGILCADLVCRFEPLKEWHPFGFGAASADIGIVPQLWNDIYGLRMTAIF